MSNESTTGADVSYFKGSRIVGLGTPHVFIETDITADGLSDNAVIYSRYFVIIEGLKAASFRILTPVKEASTLARHFSGDRKSKIEKMRTVAKDYAALLVDTEQVTAYEKTNHMATLADIEWNSDSASDGLELLRRKGLGEKITTPLIDFARSTAFREVVEKAIQVKPVVHRDAQESYLL